MMNYDTIWANHETMISELRDEDNSTGDDKVLFFSSYSICSYFG